MKFYIRIEGVDGKTSIPLENLLDKGITPKTWVCIEGTENWDLAENFNELKSLWNPNPKDKNKNISLTKRDDIVSKIQPEEKKINSIQENKPSIENIEEQKNIILSPFIIKRAFIIVIVILIVFFIGRWGLSKLNHQDKLQEPNKYARTSETCKEHFDSLLVVGESHIEEINKESLIAFQMLSNHKQCIDTIQVNNTIELLRNKKNTEKLLINDPDVKKRDEKLDEAINLLKKLKE